MERSCKTCKNKTWEYSNNDFPDICIECNFIEVNGEKQPSNWKPLPMTNADRIRAMSDEELAEDFCKTVLGVMNQLGVVNTGSVEDAVRKRLEWLKQPAEVEHE